MDNEWGQGQILSSIPLHCSEFSHSTTSFILWPWGNCPLWPSTNKYHGPMPKSDTPTVPYTRPVWANHGKNILQYVQNLVNQIRKRSSVGHFTGAGLVWPFHACQARERSICNVTVVLLFLKGCCFFNWRMDTHSCPNSYPTSDSDWLELKMSAYCFLQKAPPSLKAFVLHSSSICYL